MRLKKFTIGIIFLMAMALTAGLGLATSQEEGQSLPENLDEYKHVNTLIVPNAESDIHGLHHFYMGKKGRQAFMQGGTNQYPDGTTFVGKVYKIVETTEGRYKEGDLAAYTLMRKDSDAQSTQDTGGWHFVMFTSDGANKDVDPAKHCFGCHEPSPETDYVLSEPLMD